MSNEAKFTPGPWTVCIASPAWLGVSIAGPHGDNPSGKFLCEVRCGWLVPHDSGHGYSIERGSDEVGMANAALIASAPALYEACKGARELFDQGCVDRGFKVKRNWIDDVLDSIDAALAAASPATPTPSK